MPRKSAFAGTWSQNARPYVVLAPDAYVSFMGQTSVIGCGQCVRRVNFNKYITGINTDGNIESPPGSANINMAIPDTEKEPFYVDGQFLIAPMMEVEIF